MAARRLPTWAWVTGLTSAAIVVVTGLAVQAGAGPKPAALDDRSPAASASDAPRPRKSLTPEDEGAATGEGRPAPAGSGTGRRVVYSLGKDEVWLVDAGDKTLRNFAVWPGTLDPAPGEYRAGTRREAVTGTDGMPIEHVVYFAFSEGVNFAFSHAEDGSSPAPAPDTRTSGVRMPVEDGTALWDFASTGTPVVVVP